jgi:hypothetical protein
MAIPFAFPTKDDAVQFIVTGGAWRDVSIPPWATMVSITLVGGGGAGGSGFTRTAGSAGGGGGGGSSGAVSRLVVPAMFLPQTFYVQTGVGGRTSNAAGTGSVVAMDMANNGNTSSRVLVANGGTGGGNGTGTGAGTAGTAATVASASTGVTQNVGVVSYSAGQAGAAGGAQTGATGGAITYTATLGLPISGGAGGGGCTTTDFAGGPVNAGGVVPTLAGGATAGGVGADGPRYNRPFFCMGGSGGGSNNSGVAGKGGDGAIGCGGGGGGAGATGGAGGAGGDGFAIICFT